MGNLGLSMANAPGKMEHIYMENVWENENLGNLWDICGM